MSVLDAEVWNMCVGTRGQNCMRNKGIRYIGELVQYSAKDLVKSRHFGRKTIAIIEEELGKLGLRLGMHLPDTIWTPPGDDNTSDDVVNTAHVPAQAPTIRDWFAMAAFAGLIVADYTAAQDMAARAYTLADAMMKARQANGGRDEA